MEFGLDGLFIHVLLSHLRRCMTLLYNIREYNPAETPY